MESFLANGIFSFINPAYIHETGREMTDALRRRYGIKVLWQRSFGILFALFLTVCPLFLAWFKHNLFSVAGVNVASTADFWVIVENFLFYFFGSKSTIFFWGSDLSDFFFSLALLAAVFMVAREGVRAWKENISRKETFEREENMYPVGENDIYEEKVFLTFSRILN